MRLLHFCPFSKKGNWLSKQSTGHRWWRIRPSDPWNRSSFNSISSFFSSLGEFFSNGEQRSQQRSTGKETHVVCPPLAWLLLDLTSTTSGSNRRYQMYNTSTGTLPNKIVKFVPTSKKRRKKSYLHYLYIHTNPISHRLGQVRSRNNFDAFNGENIGVERKGWIDRIGVCPASSLSLSQLRVSCSHVANRTNIKFFWCFPIFKWADRYYVVFCCCSDLYEGKRRRPRTLHRDEIPVGSLSRGILCRKFPLRLTVWITIADATDFWPLRTGRRLFFPFRYHLVSKTCRPCQSSLRLLPEDWQRRRKTLQKTSSTCSFFWIASRSFLLETRTVWRWPNN